MPKKKSVAVAIPPVPLPKAVPGNWSPAFNELIGRLNEVLKHNDETPGDLTVAARERLDMLVAAHVDDIFGVLLKLALGYTDVLGNEHNPDRRAAEYLLNRTLGKPTQAITVTPELTRPTIDVTVANQSLALITDMRAKIRSQSRSVTVTDVTTTVEE